MRNKKIGIKFCGHCSPRRDMQKLSVQLKEEAGCITFVHYSEDQDVDALLILNACEVACAKCPDYFGPVIIVTPETVDHWPVERGFLAKAILKRLT